MSLYYERKWMHHNGYWLDQYPFPQRIYAAHYERRNTAILASVPNGLDTVLDVGCGVGDLMLPLARKSRSVLGIDVAAANVHQARKNLLRSGVENAALVLCAAEALPFRGQSFDAVVMADVIEHIPDVDSALLEARRVLRAGGLFICVTPRARFLRFVATVDRFARSVLLFPFRRPEAMDSQVFERFLTASELGGALRRAGFSVQMYRRVCFYPGGEGAGLFGLFMHWTHKALGDRWFTLLAKVVVHFFSVIERIQVFNQKQMWVARGP